MQKLIGDESLPKLGAFLQGVAENSFRFDGLVQVESRGIWGRQREARKTARSGRRQRHLSRDKQMPFLPSKIKRQVIHELLMERTIF